MGVVLLFVVMALVQKLAGVLPTRCCLCGLGSGGDDEVVKACLHSDAEGLVVPVDRSPDDGLASHPRAADADQDRLDDLVAEGEQGAQWAAAGAGVW